jgi:hypothetical protein
MRLDAVTIDQGQALLQGTQHRLSVSRCTWGSFVFRCLFRTGSEYQRENNQDVLPVFVIQFIHRLEKSGGHHTSKPGIQSSLRLILSAM